MSQEQPNPSEIHDSRLPSNPDLEQTIKSLEKSGAVRCDYLRTDRYDARLRG